MDRHNHLSPPSLGMRSALTKGLALTSCAGTPGPKISAPDVGLHLASELLKPCLHYNKKASASSAVRGPSKAVCFAPEVRMKNIPRRTASLINETWYSLGEQRQFMEEAMAVVKLRRHCVSMSENDFEETHNESIQGLEHYLSKRQYITSKEEQEAVITVVPLFQAKMRTKGLPIDREALAHVSQVLSAPARERAYQKGLQHARSSRSSCGHTAHAQRQNN